MTNYNVRKIEEMSSGIKAQANISRGCTHYLCRWNSDGTRNSVIRPYKSYAAANKAAEKAESMMRANQ